MAFDECKKLVELKNAGGEAFYNYIMENLGIINQMRAEVLLEMIDLNEVKDRPDFFSSIVICIESNREIELGFRESVRLEMIKELLPSLNDKKNYEYRK